MSNNQKNLGSMANFPTITMPGGWYTYLPGGFQIATDPGDLSVIDDAPVIVEEKKINKDGCRCKKCKEYYEFAQPNQDDGTLICYVCRKGL